MTDDRAGLLARIDALERERRRSFDEAQREADALFAQYQLSQLIASGEGLAELAAAVLSELVRLAGAAAGALWLGAPDGDRLDRVASVGSATTDGGFGAIRAIRAPARLRAVELLVACDVRTRFTEAAVVFGPQKGASAAQVALLTGRLERLVQVYREQFGVDVSNREGAGAAGRDHDVIEQIGDGLPPEHDAIAPRVHARAAHGRNGGLRRLAARLVGQVIEARSRRPAAALGAARLHHR